MKAIVSQKNKTGFRGVIKREHGHTFQAKMKIIKNGKKETIFLGSFVTARAAAEYYAEAKELWEKEGKLLQPHRLTEKELDWMFAHW